MPKRGTPLTHEQQNVLRVIAAALVALVCAAAVAIYHRTGDQVVSIFPLAFPGMPLAILNIIIWRVKMVW